MGRSACWTCPATETVNDGKIELFEPKAAKEVSLCIRSALGGCAAMSYVEGLTHPGRGPLLSRLQTSVSAAIEGQEYVAKADLIGLLRPFFNVSSRFSGPLMLSQKFILDRHGTLHSWTKTLA